MYTLPCRRTGFLWAPVAGAALLAMVACAAERQSAPAPTVVQAAPAVSAPPDRPSATVPAPTAGLASQAASASSLPTATPTPTPTPAPRVCTVAVGSVALRSGPATIYNPVRPPVIVERGEILAVTARIDQGTWVQVATATGASGWAPAGFLRCEAPEDLPVVTPPPTPSPTAEPEATPSTLRPGMPNDPLPAASGQAPRSPRSRSVPARRPQPGRSSAPPAGSGSGSSGGSVPTSLPGIELPPVPQQPLPTITPPTLPTVVPRP